MSAEAKRFARARGGRLTTPMERYLMTVLDERGQDNLLHVSDLVKNAYCPRMLYYRMNGIRPSLESVSFQLQRIFDYGSTAHTKYQRYWQDMGVIWGRWLCNACGRKWIDMPVATCPYCGVNNKCIVYNEVPLSYPEAMLVGNADGEIRDGDGNMLVEVKTVSEGTFRVEVPKLLGQYTREVTFEDGSTAKHVDIAKLWRELTRPLPSHSRQGQTYIALRSMIPDQPPVEGMTYFYENKANQGLKEFMVLPDKSVADQVLDRSKDVAWSVRRGVPPRCPEGRDGCKLCAPYQEEATRGNNPAPKSARRPVFSGTQRVG